MLTFGTKSSLRYTPKPIPPFPDPLVGRDNDVDDIVIQLRNPGFGIAILGSGGIGKTEVATAVLHNRTVQDHMARFDSSSGATGQPRALGPPQLPLP